MDSHRDIRAPVKHRHAGPAMPMVKFVSANRFVASRRRPRSGAGRNAGQSQSVLLATLREDLVMVEAAALDEVAIGWVVAEHTPPEAASAARSRLPADVSRLSLPWGASAHTSTILEHHLRSAALDSNASANDLPVW